MATYAELAQSVLDWSNRSKEVLPLTIVKQCITYANDEAYRQLRIAPLETVREFNVTAAQARTSSLPVPTDAVEFIQLRKQRTNANRFVADKYDVAEARADIRSLYGDNLTLFSDYAYTRDRNNLIISPELVEGDTWELYYYRRLSEPAERNAPDQSDTDTILSSPSALNDYNGTFDPDISSVAVSNRVGTLKDNWLRDINEKVLLFGALHQAFDYLDEPEQSGKYKGKFEQEVAKLNDEEMRRQVNGGNVQINFFNRLI